jgi:Endosomal/lysosomal potassium channel TMEM175
MADPEPPAAARHRQFRLRGREVLRVEAFSDAVFAFAATLLVAALLGPLCAWHGSWRARRRPR